MFTEVSFFELGEKIMNIEVERLLWETTKTFYEAPRDYWYYMMTIMRNEETIYKLLLNSELLQKKYKGENSIHPPLRVTFQKDVRRGIFVYLIDKNNTYRYLAESYECHFPPYPSQEEDSEILRHIQRVRDRAKDVLYPYGVPHEENGYILTGIKKSEVTRETNMYYQIQSKAYPNIKFLNKNVCIVDKETQRFLVKLYHFNKYRTLFE